MNKVAVVVLAAGQGRRMNGDTKQLVRFGDETLITRAVRTAKQSSVGDVFVVLGYKFEQISELLNDTFANSTPPEHAAFNIVQNPDWSEGIAASIRAAVTAVDGYDAVLFMTVDQPFVDENWLKRLRDAFIESRKDVVASVYGAPQSPGIPALFSKSKFSALSMLQGDRGAKQAIIDSDPLLLDTLLAKYDIDTKGDLEECLDIQRSIQCSPLCNFVERGEISGQKQSTGS